MNGARAALLAFCLSIIDTIGATAFLAGCANLPFAGVNSPYLTNPVSASPE